jgi:hypothetical protein
VLLFVGLATLSFLYNRTDSLLVFFNGLFRQNLKYVLLFYAVVYSALSRRLMERLILLVIALVLAQVPITLVQSRIYEHWDFVGGTLGHATTGVLALLILMVLSLLMGFSQAYRRPRYLLLSLLLVIPVVLGEGKIAFVFALPLLLLLLAYRWKLLKPANLALLAGSVLVLGLALVALNRILPEAHALNVLFSPAYALNRYERSLAATGGFPRSRLGDLEFTAQLLRESPSRLLIGYGPGSSSRAFAEAAHGSLYRRFAPIGGRYFYFSFTQLSMTALEYGIVGLVLHLLLLLRLYRRNKRFLVRAEDKFWWAISWGYRGVVFVYVASIVYWRVWSTEILASWFWMLTGMLFVQASRDLAARQPLP